MSVATASPRHQRTVRESGRFPPASGRVRLMQWLRLFELEIRRGPGIVGAGAIALATFWMMWQELPNGVVYWEAINR
ncbi:MAG TPA: hypothetical protein VNZ55_12460, partial [Thermomicrobiales bacterium]|nr:hypothetical protein [Thermomicrobiales bacterium]